MATKVPRHYFVPAPTHPDHTPPAGPLCDYRIGGPDGRRCGHVRTAPVHIRPNSGVKEAKAA